MKYQQRFTEDDFSLTESGLLYKILVKAKMVAPAPRYLLKRSIILVMATWVPLLILSAIQGLLINDKLVLPFLYDVTTHLRLLVVIPLLVFAEKSVDFRLNEFIDQFFISGIIKESNKPLYMEIRARGKKLIESLWADLIMLVIIIANITIRGKTALDSEFSSWLQSVESNDSGASWAGTYFLFICMPIVQFILLRWLWRWVIWFYFFLKISKLPLRLRPAHADGAGGIGFIGTPPGPFVPVTLAISILFSSAILEQVIFMDHKLPEYYLTMGAFIVLSIILNILPLMVFMKPLINSRRKAIFEYSALIHHHHQQFDDKWINSNEPGALLGNPDPSSTADINSVFQTIKSMKTMPFDLKTMASTILISALPMLPLFVLQYSVTEIIQKVLSLLL
jgi:hypothetical protein